MSEEIFYCGEEPIEEQTLTGLPSGSVSPVLITESDVDVTFRTNRVAFRRILSSLINGARLTYPDEWQQVVWDFQRWFDDPL